MFLSNVLPLTFGMVLLRSHVFSGLTWAVFAVLGTQTCDAVAIIILRCDADNTRCCNYVDIIVVIGGRGSPVLITNRALLMLLSLLSLLTIGSLDACRDFHDFHHQKFNTNYGLTGWCDALHGTDKQWKVYLEKRRSDEEKKGVKRSSGNNAMYLFFLTILIILTGTSLAPWTVQAGVV
eukprot:SAG31_NODE_2700_length_5224_cov_2.317854_5_plen_179_part_00